ncbi:MAG: VanZ family protein [Vicinamibacterales bacterium]
MTRAVSLWGPVVLYMAVIFYSSAQPDPGLPPGLTDKPTHSIAYAVLGGLVVRALAGGLPARITLATAVAGVALTAAYGATDEIHQMFVPGRYADANDLAADAIGGAIGAFVCWLWGIISASPGRSRGTSRHGL